MKLKWCFRVFPHNFGSYSTCWGISFQFRSRRKSVKFITSFADPIWLHIFGKEMVQAVATVAQAFRFLFWLLFIKVLGHARPAAPASNPTSRERAISRWSHALVPYSCKKYRLSVTQVLLATDYVGCFGGFMPGWHGAECTSMPALDALWPSRDTTQTHKKTQVPVGTASWRSQAPSVWSSSTRTGSVPGAPTHQPGRAWEGFGLVKGTRRAQGTWDWVPLPNRVTYLSCIQ